MLSATTNIGEAGKFTANEGRNSYIDQQGTLQFLWLELTNICNLRCIHCYAESSPLRADDDLLSPKNYLDVISSSAQLGCKKVQFIGGEPTLNKHLPDFIRHARLMGYEYIEVFTNLTCITPQLINCFVENDVHIATSAYSHLSTIHDQITNQIGSFAQTMRNIDIVLATPLPLRVGIIAMPLNEDHLDDTISFLREKGVESISVDRVRDFGRGASEATSANLQNLCGNCAGSTVCVSPSGQISPCIMSKAWSVGSILNTPFAEIVQSRLLTDLRQQIYEHAVAPFLLNQSQCEPYCHPSCGPSCSPSCHPSCGPSARR